MDGKSNRLDHLLTTGTAKPDADAHSQASGFRYGTI
jgi:hypothetical protein